MYYRVRRSRAVTKNGRDRAKEITNRRKPDGRFCGTLSGRSKEQSAGTSSFEPSIVN